MYVTHCSWRLLIEGLRRLLLLLPGREVDHGSMEAWWRARSCHRRLRLFRTWSHMILLPALTPRGDRRQSHRAGTGLRTAREDSESGWSGIYSFPLSPPPSPLQYLTLKWRNHRRNVCVSRSRSYDKYAERRCTVALPFIANFTAGAIAGISEILTFYPLGESHHPCIAPTKVIHSCRCREYVRRRVASTVMNPHHES